MAASVQEVQRSVSPSALVLVVEDEHLVALDIQTRLARMGYVAHVAYSGEEAIAKAHAMRFDVVLMDVKLKGPVDGIEAAREIRAAMDVPVVYVTAYADSQTLERARSTEPYGYLLKPFQERELRAVIEMTLERHGNDQQRREQQQIQHFLADASSRMAASLDYRAVAGSVAELLVPRYADWCAIHLEEVDDTVPAFTHVHPDGSHEVACEVTALLEEVVLEGTPVQRAAGDSSLACVPLPARGQVLGALALVARVGRPHYVATDLAFAEDLGQRLGLALDNALLYRKAERAITMRDDVLAIVSHDLRTPLGTILMQAEVIARHPDVKPLGELIVRSAQRMHRLIGDLLDASAINAGRLALERGTHPVAAVAREALDMFRAEAAMRDIELHEELPDETATACCDRDRIVQVLSNLLGNALKFTPRGGSVIVAAAPIPGGVRFAVSDTGQGIPAEQVPHLFDQFWRGQARGPGAGLGLFIARGIVAAHGGTLGVDTTVDKGSVFHFTIPCAPA